MLHSERFVDLSPWQVYAQLLEEQRYLCSVRTMYRILSANREVRERRNQLKHPKYKAPELLATTPNQVWSWDITKLLGPQKWTYFYLYVVQLDVQNPLHKIDVGPLKLKKLSPTETCQIKSRPLQLS